MPYTNLPHPEERPALRDAALRRLLRMRGVRLEGRRVPMPVVIGRVLVLLVVVLALAGCGKKGAPQPPADEPNTFPRTYPSA